MVSIHVWVLGIYFVAGVKQPSHYKTEVFPKIDQPNTWVDSHMLIRIFGLYSQFLPLYDIKIRPWR